MNIETLIGITGATLVLVVFFLNQIHKLSTDSFLYDFVNFIGGLLLLIYAILIASLPFAIINGIWTLASLRDIFVDIKNKKKALP